MSTETLFLKENSLAKELELRNSSKTEVTQIKKVTIIQKDKLEISIRRPSTGTGIKYGGVTYVLDGITGETLKTFLVEGTEAELTFEIQDSTLDFTENYYTIGYGPNNVDQNVNSIAATVKLIQGEIEDFKASICYKLNARNNRVSGRYSVPFEYVNANSLRAYLVEGNELKDSKHAIQNVIDKPGYKGTIDLEFPDGTLVIGKEYTLCLNVYSWTREIAGQTFTLI